MKRKRIISLVMSFVLAVGILFTADIQAEAISRNDVVSQLNSYISQYNGKTANSNQMYMGSQCKGFANWIFLKIFGVYIGPYPESANYKISNPQAQTVGIIEPGNLNVNTAKALLQKGVPGDYIQVQRSTARGRGPHSMILTGVNDSGIDVFDCNSDGRNTIKSYSISWSAFDTANRAMSLYHAYNYTASQVCPPQNTQIHLDKQVYGLDHNLSMSFSADGAVEYYIAQIWNGNKLICSKQTTEAYLEMPCSQLGAGSYGVYVTACNSYGHYTSSTVGFRIAERLSNPQLHINKTEFGVTDTMEFIAAADGGPDYYGLQIWKDSTVVYGETFIGHTINVPCTKLGVGNYGAFISCVNESGSINSQTIYFKIGSELSNPQIRLNKKRFDVTDTMEFIAAADGGPDYYGLQIWKGATVVYGETFIGHTINVPCTKLGVGNYGAFISCVNGLGNINTETVSFVIGTENTESGSYADPSFIWSSDFKTCKAEFTSINGKDKQSIDCKVTDKIAQETTCAASGVELHIATVSFDDVSYTDMKNEMIKAKGHNYNEWEEVSKATCLEEGIKSRKCSDCGNIEKQSIAKTNHTYRTEIILPSCDKVGYSHHECSVCGNSYDDTYIAKAGHNYSTNTREATCTSEGLITYICKECGEKTTEIIPKKDHNYKEEIKKQTTCTEAGVKEYICSICNDSYTETLPSFGHEYIDDEAIDATCTEEGKTSGRHCIICNAVIDKQKTIPAKGHCYKMYMVKADIKNNGNIIRKCTVCGDITKNTVIFAPKEIELSQTSSVYNGRTFKLSIIVKDIKGQLLKEGTDYIVSYPSNMRNVGKYKIVITFQGKYTGSMTKNYEITPRGTSISGLISKKKGLTIKWKRQASQTTGYEISYSTNKKFERKDTKTVTIKNNKTTSRSISKLKAKKKYYVRVRTYKTVKVNGKSVKIHSGWSKVKSVSTKR